MPRVLVLNNYPLDAVWDEVRRGEKPDHHLYGVNYFPSQGYDCEIVPFRSSSLLNALNRAMWRSRFPVPLGDLDQQWSAFAALDEADLIYSPCQTQTSLLGYLRALGVIRTPIVCLAHHPPEVGRLAPLRAPFLRLELRGVDAVPSLSEGVAAAIRRIAGDSAKSSAIAWGPQADYYTPARGPGAGVVAAGRTARDFDTLARAASGTDVPVHIIGLEGSLPEGDFPENVRLDSQPRERYMAYPELSSIYASARVLAIPLLPGQSLSGLTSLMDALGIGKPVIMTRHPLIDLDIEREGIGKWVDPGDVDGWRAAIRFFHEDADAACEMGSNARRLVDEGLNSRRFAEKIVDVFDAVLGR